MGCATINDIADLTNAVNEIHDDGMLGKGGPVHAVARGAWGSRAPR